MYPAEVEEHLRRSPLVHEAVVVSIPDERLGELPVAGIVWEGEADDAAVIAELRGELAHYKVPRHLFPLVDVPRTPRDKVDRKTRRRARPRGARHPRRRLHPLVLALLTRDNHA